MTHIEQYRCAGLRAPNQYKMLNFEEMEPEQNGWLLSNDFGLLHYF